MKAQEQIRSANILLITMRALGNEISKNLVLAGIGSLTILDDGVITEPDLGAQFFVQQEHVGMNRALAASIDLQKLNPRVKIVVDADGVKSKGQSYFSLFDIVIATDLDPGSLNLINTATRLHRKKFYAAGSHGLYGFFFSDLIEHEYVIKRDIGNISTQIRMESRTRSVIDVQTRKESGKTIELVTKRDLYSTWLLANAATLPEEYTRNRRRLRGVHPGLSCFRALWEFISLNNRAPDLTSRPDLALFTTLATAKHAALDLPAETLKSEFLRDFLQNVGSEFAPATAILGGQLAQDVIYVLGQNQQPIQNMVIFDGNMMEANVYPLHPEGPLGANLLQLANTDVLVSNGAAEFVAVNPAAAMVTNGAAVVALPDLPQEAPIIL
jgi:ubiquitin-like 1-activating enzyme E1 A